MAPVHKLISGGEQWLPFALSKLRSLGKLAPGIGGYASQQFTMPDGAEVAVRIVQDQQFLRIDGGGPAYEFYTSEPIFPTTVSTGEYTGGLGSFGVTGSGLRAKPGTQWAKPLFSSFLAPDATDPKWTLRDKDYIMASNEAPVSANFKTAYSWQHQKFFEYVTWPNNGSSSMVTSTQGMTPGRNSMANWDSPYRESALGNQYAWLHDEGNDVPPCYYDAKGAKPAQPSYEDMDRIWTRHAAVQTAGGRQFFICTDNFGRFQVYPVKDYPLFSGRHLVNTYWLATPPYPAWVTVPDPSNPAVRLNEWHWAFNKDATKVVSCPFHSVAADLLIVKEETNRAPDLNYGLRMNLALHSSEVDSLPAGTPTMPGRHDTPGLVEFGIAITVTGPGDMDFSVAFTLLRNSYALDDNRYFFDAAYSLPDKGDKALMPWAEDTLVTAEVQVFVAPGNYAAGPISHALGGYSASPATFTHNANLPVGYIVIATNDAAMVATERLKLQAIATDGAFLTTQGFYDNFVSTADADHYIWRPDVFANVRAYRPASLGGKALGPDPCVPSALALASTPTPSPTVPEPTRFVFIRSLELRTMSVSYDLYDYAATGVRSRALMAYNEVIVDSPQELLSVRAGPDRAVLNTERVPCAAIAHYNAVINNAFWTQPSRGFSIHPAGHWGHSSGASASSDIVNTKRGKKSRRTTHKALFNKAFGQTRDYSYYSAPNPGALTGANYKEYAAYYFGHLGGFRTNGVWLTF